MVFCVYDSETAGADGALFACETLNQAMACAAQMCVEAGAGGDWQIVRYEDSNEIVFSIANKERAMHQEIAFIKEIA